MSMPISRVQTEGLSMWAARLSGAENDFHLALGREEASFPVDFGREVTLVGG